MPPWWVWFSPAVGRDDENITPPTLCCTLARRHGSHKKRANFLLRHGRPLQCAPLHEAAEEQEEDELLLGCI